MLPGIEFKEEYIAGLSYVEKEDGLYARLHIDWEQIHRDINSYN